MGIGNLEKMKPTHETPDEILELVRTSVLETLQPNFYHSQDEHSKAAIELHKLVATKYPNFYSDVYTDKEFLNYFLDAHRIMSLPYILQNEENIDAILTTLFNIQPNRIEDIYRICKMKELFGVSVPNRILRKLFNIQAEHFENEKGKDYIGLMGTKYSTSIHNIMASTRIKKYHLTPSWKEVMSWVFNKDENFQYTLPSLIEASKLRKLVKDKRG